MSFLVKGGYDAIRKQVVNISLRRTDKWARGLIFVQDNRYVGGLNPVNENNIEVVKFDDRHALLLNNAIIYEDKKLFNYKLELQCETDPDLNDPALYDFLKYKNLTYSEMRAITMRWDSN
jgi:hypothetical protein